MIQNLKTLFFLKKGREYKGGPMPIYLRITIDGARAEASIQRSCEPKKWSQRNGRAIGTKTEVVVLNTHLDIIQGNIFQIQRACALAVKKLSAKEFITNLFQTENTADHSLMNVFKEHNSQFEKLVGKEFSYGTLKKFKTALSHLENFVEWKFQKKDVDLAMINHLFVKDFEFYLKTIPQMQHNTAMSNIKKLKKITRFCVANEWLAIDPFKSYKITTKETHRVFLMHDELEFLQSKVFTNTRLDQVRDIFIFSCYTGLAYSDVIKLMPKDVSVGIDGEQWIFTNRTKTDSQSRIPLLPVAKGLIEKYSKNPKIVSSGRLLPNLSNEKLNAYLKEISVLCGLKNELTFHCARHTFATTVTLTNGVPIETVGKMLGHKSLRTTQIYAKILDSKVSEDMKMLRSRLQNNKDDNPKKWSNFQTTIQQTELDQLTDRYGEDENQKTTF
ncbi:MAG: site-specific integrase [Chitinophagaceae bacterium]